MMPAVQAAQSSQGEMLQVLAAMGVMNGDEKGNLNLEATVTRAAFIKMAVAASVYKDMATAASYVSPFPDVNYTHWAAGYIKTGVDAGTGGREGGFSFDRNGIFRRIHCPGLLRCELFHRREQKYRSDL